MYDHTKIEACWQKFWADEGLFQNVAGGQADSKKDKMFLLFAFAYPSGSGLHVGHVESNTALDMMARYWRMNGKQVMFPVGWDAFGLPAENYAIKTGIPPAQTTRDAINTFRGQIQRLAISYDWAGEIATSHPGYYRWTQWLFLKLYEKGLAYKAPGLVNWCPSCQTVLANEQVVDGKCERCETQVIQRSLEQWYFKITKYKDELISGLDQVDWPSATKQQQINWIGKKKGIDITYQIEDEQGRAIGDVTCFSTRPDTNFGATFVVLAPEHKLAIKIAKQKKEMAKYLATASHKTELERQQEGQKKTGVFTGWYAINNLTNKRMPVWISDFVLGGFGTGAVVGVPSHDRRDFEFAKVYNLEVKPVVRHQELTEYRSYLMGVDSVTDQELTKLGISFALEGKKARKLTIPASKYHQYQQLIREKLTAGFWNEVIGDEIWFCFKDKTGQVTELVLDASNWNQVAELCHQYNSDSIEKTQNLWLYLASNSWYTDLMIQETAGVMINSDFLDGLETHQAIGKMMDYLEEKGWGKRVTTYKLRDWLISRQRYWGAPIPIVYDPEGKPHPVKNEHLPWLLPEDVDFKPTGESPLKSSQEFFERTERLYGKGWTPEVDTMDTFVDSSWYYLRYTDPRNEQEFASPDKLKQWSPVDFYMIGQEHIVLHLLYSRFFTKFLRDEGYLNFDEPFLKMRHQGMILGPNGKKMSKSKGNVITPDEVIEKFGADTLRLYEMFMGPIDADKPWDARAVIGIYKFLKRIHGLAESQLANHRDLAIDRNLDSNRAIASNPQPWSAKDGRKKFHQTLQKVTQDIPQLKFNTAIAFMMELVNVWEKTDKILREDWENFVLMLAPFAPFLAEDIYQQMKQAKAKLNSSPDSQCSSVHLASWPQADSELAQDEQIIIPIQINGKVRAQMEWPSAEIDNKSKVLETARALPQLKHWLDGQTVKKEIYVPGKIVNFVTVAKMKID
ncbi:MAG: class I tRNA ligase family protein [Patescibacteria group bacterium]